MRRMRARFATMSIVAAVIAVAVVTAPLPAAGADVLDRPAPFSPRNDPDETVGSLLAGLLAMLLLGALGPAQGLELFDPSYPSVSSMAAYVLSDSGIADGNRHAYLAIGCDCQIAMAANRPCR